MSCARLKIEFVIYMLLYIHNIIQINHFCLLYSALLCVVCDLAMNYKQHPFAHSLTIHLAIHKVFKRPFSSIWKCIQ